jgi:flavodoxin
MMKGVNGIMADKVLVAYYSHSGNTKRLAELIHLHVGGDIYEITPAVPYHRDYATVVNQAKKEIREGYRPELAAELGSIEPYSRVFVGSPIWWSTVAPPLATFLSSYDFAGKIVLPFCTHGGGGVGRIERDIAGLCPQARVMGCLGVHGSTSIRVETILDWAQDREDSIEF